MVRCCCGGAWYLVVVILVLVVVVVLFAMVVMVRVVWCLVVWLLLFFSSRRFWTPTFFCVWWCWLVLVLQSGGGDARLTECCVPCVRRLLISLAWLSLFILVFIPTTWERNGFISVFKTSCVFIVVFSSFLASLQLRIWLPF